MDALPRADAEREALIQRIREAFADAPPPAVDNIATCWCEECGELRDALIGRHPDDLSDEWVSRNFDQLPLLSDDAKRYFLPAYLRAALREEGCVEEFLFYSLESDHHWEPSGGYSPRQRAAVFEYLTFGDLGEPKAAEDSDEPDVEGQSMVLKRWRPAR